MKRIKVLALATILAIMPVQANAASLKRSVTRSSAVKLVKPNNNIKVRRYNNGGCTGVFSSGAKTTTKRIMRKAK